MARILVVDDELSLLTVIGALLRSEGYEVVAVRGGDAALSAIESQKFDLVISDVRMAPVDGMQVLKHAGELCPAVPVIMMTAYVSEKVRAQAKELGAIAFLAKPFESNELLKIVQAALAGECE